MSWNFRVLVSEIKTSDGVDMWYAIHEVYYDENNVPKSCTQSSTIISGTSKKELKWTLKAIKKSLSKPFLWGDDRFPEEYKS